MSTRRYISSFGIENFGAFYSGGYPRIGLPNGESLLVYGENGSGKSSVYKAFSQFFESSANAVTFNINKLLDNQPGTIEITFTTQEDGGTGNWQTVSEDTYNFNSTTPSTNNQNFIQQSNKIRGFLSYQQLVKTYTLPTSLGNSPNLYELIVEQLLWHHELPNSNRTIENYWTELEQGFILKHAGRKLFKTAVAALPDFNERLKILLYRISLRVNFWLKEYFGFDVVISIQTARVSLHPRSYAINRELFLNVEHYQTAYLEYQNFLNEARLSALAICFYLAGIKMNPTGTNYKLLFLDDIFIGLDTSNRLPLLDILKDEFSDFQIFMTTYDRNWFELAKDQLNAKKWKLLEMYHDDIEGPASGGSTMVIGQKPVFIESTFDFLSKARAYFDAKDYPASANYLRKEVERNLRRLLPIERRLNYDENFGARDETKLENLFNSFNTYISDCNIALPNNTINALKLYRSLVLNPQSHSDINSPVYRSELEKAFTAIQHLSRIPEIVRTIAVSIGSRFVYSNAANHNYTMELELAENIYKVSCGAATSISTYKFRIVDWNWNGTQFATALTGNAMTGQELIDFCNDRRTLQQVFQVITYGNHNPMPANLEQNITQAGQTLHQLLV